MGRAGSLEVTPGKRLVDRPDFPARWKDGALKAAAFLDEPLGEAEPDRAFASPAAMLAPGERTGPYRVGGNRFMADGNGESRISLEHRAVAMLGEVERPQHHRKRFSVAC